MSRFLTPAKIGLLAMSILYVDGSVPMRHGLPMLQFIMSHLVPNYHPDPTIAPGSTLILPIEEFERIGKPVPSTVKDRTVWDVMLKKLWGIDSLDALHAFFDHLSLLLVKTREEMRKDAARGIAPPPPEKILLTRNSPLGMFVLRSQQEFIRSQFEDAVTLWEAFIAYRQCTFPAWKKLDPEASRGRFDVSLDGLRLDDPLTQIVYGNLMTAGNPDDGQVSTEDVARLLEFQIEEMQKLGNRITDDIRTQFERMIDSKVTTPSLTHYIKFLDSWRSGDYSSSFEHLHRYFDYTMQTRDRTFYQYALLNLAIMQADFGCYAEAVTAMQETISAARENKDQGCLNFSLSWLYHFGKAHPSYVRGDSKIGTMTVERDGLAFLRAKAKEAGMWSLYSTSLLSEAKLGLQNGESVAVAFENILKSSHVNVTKGMGNVIGSQFLLQSSLWSRLGVTHLAFSSADTFLTVHASRAPLEDVLRSICRTAYIMSHKGEHKEAMARIREVGGNTTKILRLYQYKAVFGGVLKLKRELHRNKLEHAERLVRHLHGQETTDQEMIFEIFYLEMDLLMRRGEYTQALEKLEAMAVQFNETNVDIMYRIRLLTLKSKLFNRCGAPLKGFSGGLRAASLAWRARVLPALWEALVTLADTLIHLREFEASVQVTNAITPQVLEYEDSALSAYTYSVQIDATMGLVSKEAPGTPKREEHMMRAMELIDRMFAEYSKVGDIKGQLESLAKKATIKRMLGDIDTSNEFARQYLLLREEWLEDIKAERPPRIYPLLDDDDDDESEEAKKKKMEEEKEKGKGKKKEWLSSDFFSQTTTTTTTEAETGTGSEAEAELELELETDTDTETESTDTGDVMVG
ncbi:MAG: hypothetical protein M1823_002545 [Watsoniomyces obsoletus]|nr:MAG: hypothetical protein M1823_002545 [Watsoniomyces obsoletus]